MTIDIVNINIEPVNLSVDKLIKWSLHDYSVKAVDNNVNHKLRSCFGVDNVDKLCCQVVQESIESCGYMFNERNQFATAEFNAEELKYIMSIAVNRAVNDYVIEDKTIPKQGTVRLKLIDLKHLIQSGMKETLKMLSITQKSETEGVSTILQQ